MKKILVIDDSATVRQQISAALFGGGFSIVEAGDGADGLVQLERNSDLAMVLCDVNMPRMNGIEMLEALHARSGAPRVPVLMLTTEAAPALVDRAKKAGAKGWIVKPFKPELLLGAVRKLTAA
jgi:two-component system chemotaxis response regulator CheY